MRDSIFDFKIDHRKWQEAATSLFAFLTAASPGEVVVVVGPSRCGKTRLISHVCNLLFPERSGFSAGKMPYVIVDAVNAGKNGSFSTKSFMLRMLMEIEHPFYSVGISGFDEIDEYKLSRIDRTTEGSMRIALERAFIIRGVLYLFIDEAQHAKYVTKDVMGAHAVLDSWKCFAKSTQIILVIVGAYPILEILQNSRHILGRKHQVHLPRYYATEEDLEEFIGIIDVYRIKLHQLGLTTDLVSCTKLLYDGSLGCIGLLRAWLMRAYAHSQAYGCGITKKLLLETKLPESDLREIATEIENGELILNGRPSTTRSAKASSGPKVKKQKAFQRNPKRETAGNRIE